MTRVEDADLITGRADYVADLTAPGQLHARVVRSSYAHGRLIGVDVNEARRRAGVVAVWTAQDLIAELGSVPRIGTRVSPREEVIPFQQPILAEDRVRYVGEPLALVIAEDPYAAEDAEELVFADIELLPVVSDPLQTQALEPLFQQGNVVTTLEARLGDPGSAFADAEVVVECALRVGRHSGVPMETRGAMVSFDENRRCIVVNAATKVPHWNRRELARLLGISPERIRMLEASVGGGFGVRGEIYPEDVLVAWAALTLERPVRWIEDRREHLIATNHSRQQSHRAAIAGTRDGRVLGIRSEFWVDLGAYVRTHGVRVPELTVTMLPGPYDIEHYEGLAHCVVTNKTPTGTYRAPGRYESCFVRERLLDMFADRIGLDPIDVRKRNVLSKDRIPYVRDLGGGIETVQLNEGDFPRLLDRVIRTLDPAAIRARQQRGESVGFGVGLFLEKSGVGPGELGSVDVEGDGTIVVRSGCSSVGQGLCTVLSQIVAETFDVPLDRIRVALLDTDCVERGTGTYASRSTATAGAAVYQAAVTVVDDAKRYAAEWLEASVDDVVAHDGGFELAGAPDRRVTLEEIAKARDEGSEGAPSLSASRFFEVKTVTHPYGAHAAVVKVDRETGACDVERLILGFDVGRAVNPMLVEGQLHGGAMQGLAGALFEQFVYDDEGNPLATSFMDYLMPTAAEAPEMVAVVTEDAPTATNPLGVKGVGEGGVTGVGAAIASAVDNALGRPGTVCELPILPSTLVEEASR
ncbi:MAG: xanthine dehydrogenase family protein molybdopterin-binding subunit [Actinomycetota bacterium]